MLTDKQIKEHEITLTSSAILNEYQKSKKPLPLFSFRKFLYIGVPCCLVAAIVIPLAVINANKKPVTPPIATLIDTKEGSRLTNAVVSSLYLLDAPSSLASSSLLRKKSITQDEFSQVVSTYEYADNLVSLQLNSSLESYQKVEDCSYTGKYGTYTSLITIKGEKTIQYYLNYSKDEKDVLFKGEVVYNNLTYLIQGKNKLEGDESEYEYTASLDEANYMTIEEEKDVDEYSYEYKVVKGGKEAYALSYQKEEEVELNFLTSASEYTFAIDYSASIWKIAYQTEDYEGTMTLERKDGQRIYTDSETQLKIVK
jgi:hypothetical protein